MAKQKPTVDFLVALRRELEQAYAEQDKEIDNGRLVREMRKPAIAVADDQYILVHVDPRDPSIADEAFRATSSLSLNRPSLKVTPTRESDSAAENSTLREHFTEATFWKIGTRRPGQDTMRDLADACANDGGAWSKILWTKNDWAESYQLTKDGDMEAGEDAKKEAGPPFLWVNVDVRTLYPVYAGGKLRAVLEVTQRPTVSTLRQYGLTIRKGRIETDSMGEGFSTAEASAWPENLVFLEYWDDEWVAYAVVEGAIGDAAVQSATNGSLGGEAKANGEIVKVFKHKYGFLPYSFAPGLWMSHWTGQSRKVGWSINHTKEWLVEYRAYLRAMHAQYVARDLLSPLFRQTPEGSAPLTGEDGKPLLSEAGPKPGTIINGRPGQVLQRIQYPDATTLEKHISMVDQAIRELSSPRVDSLSGDMGSGFAINQVLSHENIRSGPIKNSLQQLLKEDTRKLWKLIRERVKETVWVEREGDGAGWLKAGPEDLTPGVRVEWKINAEQPSASLIEWRLWHERIKSLTASPDMALEAMGENPDEVRRSLALARIRDQDWYKSLQEKMLLQQAGRGDLMRKAAQAVARTGLVPGMPIPGAMGNGQVPDMGALALSPNGAGAAPMNGSVVGGGPGAVVPEQGAAAGIQSIGS